MPRLADRTVTVTRGPLTLTAPIRPRAGGGWQIDLAPGTAGPVRRRLNLRAGSQTSAERHAELVLQALLRGHDAETITAALKRGELQELARTPVAAPPAAHARDRVLTPSMAALAPMPSAPGGHASPTRPASMTAGGPVRGAVPHTAAVLPPMSETEMQAYEAQLAQDVCDFLEQKFADELIGASHRKTLSWQYQVVLDVLVRSGLDLYRLDVGAVAIWMKALQEDRQQANDGRAVSAKTRVKYADALSALVDWLRGRGRGPAVNPVPGHPDVPRRKKRTKGEPKRAVPSLEDIVSILDYAPTAPRSAKNPWIPDAFVLGFHSGLRPIELWGLTRGDVRLLSESDARRAGIWPARGWLTVRTNKWRQLGKSPEDRHVPLWPEAAKLLEHRLRQLDADDPTQLLYPKPGGGLLRRTSSGFRRFLVAALGEVRGKAFDGYTWRHAYISLRLRTVDAADHPVSVHKVAEEVGHASAAMIEQHYARPIGMHQSLTCVDYREALKLQRAERAVMVERPTK